VATIASTWRPTRGERPALGLPPLEAGSLLLRRYRCAAPLGAGGFGEVWAAVDEVTGRDVAVKRLPMAAGVGLPRIRRELAALRHARVPGVVRLLDDGVEEGAAWIVMERLSGPAFLAGVGDWADVVDDVRALLRTLTAVHRTGIVHGDLKPSNIVTVAGRGPVLVDFGVARGRALAAETASLGFTRPYAAPELLAGASPGPGADLYAVGVMLFEFLSGLRFDGWGAAGRPPLGDAASAVPCEVATLVERLTDADPARRPREALQVLEAVGGVDGVPEASLAALPDQGDARALLDLFHGPDLLLHLRTDAARELHRRTEGVRSRVREELAGWTAAGLARWEGGRAHVGRRSVERLATGMVVVHPAKGEASSVAASLLGERVSAVELGALHAEVRALRFRGQLAQALALIELGLDVAPDGEEQAVDGLLTEMTLAALGANAADAVERALYELERRSARTAHHEALWALMRAGARLVDGRRAEARPIIAHLPPFADDELEDWRMFLLVHGREVTAMADAEAGLLDLAAWASESPLRQARWQGWLANVRYQQGRCEEAARLHQAALRAREAAGAPVEYLLASRTMAAMSWLDAGDLEKAGPLAAAAAADAASIRHTVFECHATWVLRCVASRRDDAVVPDLALVDAAFAVSRPMGAQVAAVEAVIAWRAGMPSVCLGLLERALAVLHERGHVGARLVLEALRWALIDRSLGVADRLLAELDAVSIAPGLRAQALGLISIGRPELGVALRASLRAAAARCPLETWAQRREVLSLREALGEGA
jgi:hypothetical protein